MSALGGPKQTGGIQPPTGTGLVVSIVLIIIALALAFFLVQMAGLIALIGIIIGGVLIGFGVHFVPVGGAPAAMGQAPGIATGVAMLAAGAGSEHSDTGRNTWCLSHCCGCSADRDEVDAEPDQDAADDDADEGDQPGHLYEEESKRKRDDDKYNTDNEARPRWGLDASRLFRSAECAHDDASSGTV